MKDKIIVYSKEEGFPCVITFLGNKWWLTSRNDILEPILEDKPHVVSDYRYLCEADETIQMKDLASMMGCVMEGAEIDVKGTLEVRMKELNNLGVKILTSPQCMNLHMRLLSTKGTKRSGEFSLFCYNDDTECGVFDMDGFCDAQDAIHCAQIFIEFFQNHGVRCNTFLVCKRDVAKKLLGKTPNMMLEIMN